MRIAALIMAGGRGERFWPRSRKSLPKQFLSLTDDGKTMIQLTVERILPLVSLEDIYIVTNKDYKQLVLEQIKGLPIKNILCEPISRNTAPCVGLGAIHISQKYKETVMLVLPSDHLIKYNGMFLNTLKDACKTAEQGNNLVALGITPDYPETGYGYIKFNDNEMNGKAFTAEKFVEKPSLETAKEYLATNKYLWNSGIYVWKVSSILSNFKIHLPSIYEGLSKVKKNITSINYEDILEREYKEFKSISIDYGIMEKSSNIYIIPGNFGWDDLGSWLAVERIHKSDELGNIVTGNSITVNTKNCIIDGTDKLIATVGLENVIIVDSEDVILICRKNNISDIRTVIKSLKESKRKKYL